uniref:Sec translocon accessory complex subunit YajC n=1 Tax=Roseihalotalea indica TaxID=2867963 RepID=A0AA49PZB0_9BACT|nr:preprotein translocase subunit YajC [Tunicatimonas sp. TK19036]
MLQFILLQASSGQSGLIGNLILLGGIAIIFYFFMIRPQQKKQKDQRTFIGGIKKGDMVVTIGGMHGRVVAMDEQSVTLEVDRGARIKFDKTSISLEASKQYVKQQS